MLQNEIFVEVSNQLRHTLGERRPSVVLPDWCFSHVRCVLSTFALGGLLLKFVLVGIHDLVKI